jgi:hypothetical protein
VYNAYKAAAAQHARVGGRKQWEVEMGYSQFHARVVSLRAVYTWVFCVRFSVRNGGAAKQLPLLFSRDHVRDRAKEAVGQWLTLRKLLG